MKQYRDVCSVPFYNIRGYNFKSELFGNERLNRTWPESYERNILDKSWSEANNSEPFINDIYVNKELVKEALRKMKSGSAIGPDGVPVECLKNGGELILEAISDIVRTSVDQKKIPNILKLAWISPIWKGGSKEDPKDYRPISLTSHIGKLVERIIRKQIQDYLSVNKLIEEEQHGSREGRGTLTQLLQQHDEITQKLMNGDQCNVVYLDFSKAFDLVDHGVLLKKMVMKGICGNLLAWILEFLDERKQRVRVNNSLSMEAPLRSGVPQGSVMGPLLFLIFISDLGENINDSVCRILKYVDDSKVIASANSEDEGQVLQDNLDVIYQWATKNNMNWND